METEVSVVISDRHPALEGHFPGHPVVPAVVILTEVINAVSETEGAKIRLHGVPVAKFISPLLPGERLTIRLGPRDRTGRAFTCISGERPVATGCLEYGLPEGGQKEEA